MNPSFRVFEIDSNSKLPRDYLQYRLNLTKANLDIKPPEWEVAYRASELFNIAYLNDTLGLYLFAQEIETNQEVYDKALEAFYSGGPDYSAYKNVTSKVY
jgi:hypothetical protein